MRWKDIVNEEPSNTSRAFNYALDMLSALRSQGQASITVEQMIDLLQNHPSMEGIRIDNTFVTNLVNTSGLVKEIKPNPEADGMPLTIFLKPPGGVGNAKTSDQVEKDKDKIHKSAMNQLKQKKKKG
jgi:hypothetical protein